MKRPDPRKGRWGRVVWAMNVLIDFVVGAGLGFIAGLVTGRVGWAVVIGCVVGAVYAVARLRFGDTAGLNPPLSPEQIAAQEDARGRWSQPKSYGG